MKCKTIFLLIPLLMAFSIIFANSENEKGNKVVITPHNKTSVLPAGNVTVSEINTITSPLQGLRGSIAYGNNLQNATMYHLDIADPSIISTYGNVSFAALCGDFMTDDPLHMWVIDLNDNYLKKVNVGTLEVVDSVNTPCPLADGLWSALPIHKGTGQIYGIATTGETSVLYEINPFVRSVTELLVLDIPAVISATFDMEGMMYLFDIDTDQMFALDINTLVYEPVGPAGFDGNYAQGMGLDPATDEVYLAAYDGTLGAQLRRLDKLTGNTVLLGNLPGETGAFGFPASTGTGIEILGLKVGDWLTAEPWHNWIGGMNRSSEVQLLVHDVFNLIMQVDFEFSTDGGANWQWFSTDTVGSEPAMSTYEESGDGDGWMGIFWHEMLPPDDMEVMFRAKATLETGEVLIAERAIPFDPTPPDGAEINLEDWIITEDEYILLDVAPGECLDLDKVWVIVEPKIDSFFKGIPPISQQPHSTTHCSPTAAAACLKYFESQGDNNICGGLSDHDLVDALAAIMKTNQGKYGTYISDIASGLANWIGNHGNNYTVRKTGYDWETMRDELERCQDVISSILWPNGGGHSMTFNSIVNEPNPDGTITVDWMDPWTGQIEYGQINPGSGHVSNMGGSGGGGSGEMGTMIIVCPKEDGPGPGGGGQVIPGPFPHPGIIVPVPYPGLWWIRIIYYDQSNHMARTDLVLKRVEGEKDWGDAPDAPFPTLAASNGAFHTLDGYTYMGATVDAEPDGQPTLHTLGDDMNNLDDEDGVTLLNSLVVGQQTTVRVVAANPCMLNAWFDFNKNGTWADAGEHVFANVPLAAGPNNLLLNVPAGIAPGNCYARFRVNQNGGITFEGDGYEGEVEDYKFIIFETYPGNKSGNPQYPDPTGWDVNFTHPALLGDDWICSETGPVEDFHFWVSWLNDMYPDEFENAIEKFDVSIFSDIPASESQTGYSMPGEELWAREFFPGEFNWEPVFRYPQGWDDPYQGFADPWNHAQCFRIDIDGFDDPFVQQEGTIYWLVISAHLQGSGGGTDVTLTLDNIDPGMLPYQPWTEAGVILQIRDLAGPASYMIEPDGISMWPALLHCDFSGLPGIITSVEVDVLPWCGPGCGADVRLYAAGAAIAQATNTLSGSPETIVVQNPGGFIPDELTVGCYEGKVLEIRLILEGGEGYQIGWKSSTDHWNDNAVYFMPDTPEQWLELYDPMTEDPIDLSFIITGGGDELLDFGDAPDGPYPTKLATNGARHVVDNMTFLGNSVDSELDGQPEPGAVGDDNNPVPTDEDGVQFLISIVPGQTANIIVKASVNGYLNAWLDFDQSSAWDGEQIFTNKQLVPGANNLNFSVPATALTGTTCARFRFTSYQDATLSYTGLAQDGEVEDYLVEIVNEVDRCKMHFIQWPDLTTNGVDVFCQNDIVVADDFRCMETGRITDIHIWGSWQYDEYPQDYQPVFRLGIWSDNPIGGNNHSEPLEPLCEYEFAGDQYEMSVYTSVPDGEWFYHPDAVNGLFPGDWTVFRYDFYIPEDLACVQDSGTVYWLSVNVLNQVTDFEFGWKTSNLHFNDYAAWQYYPGSPPWNMVCYPDNHPLNDECADMAFYISGPADTTSCPDVWIKDCDMDVGGVPSTPTCGSLCQGPDIWVDNNSDGIMDNPVVGAANRLYIRARNLGPGTASNVTSSLYYRNCATGLTFPTGATFIGSVTPLTIASGGSASGWVSWTVPSPPTTGGHWCIGGLVSSPCDPYTPDVSSQWDNNTCFVNIWALYNRAGSPVPPKDAEPEPVFVNFDLRNPNPVPGLFILDADVQLPDNWLLEFFVGDGMPIDLPYEVFFLPEQEMNVRMQATPPPDAVHGDGGVVIVKQYDNGYPAPEALIGDITYPIRVDLYQPASIPDLSADIVNEDVELQWTPIAFDVAGNEDHIACYNVYRGYSPDFEPGEDNRVGRVAFDQNEDKPGFQWYDEGVVNNKEIIYYLVRVEDEAGYESDNSNLAMVQFGEAYDFGDAPQPPYRTMLNVNGARHLIDGLTYLGDLIDSEPNGQPDITATGDDLNNMADEDGVVFRGPLVTGKPCVIKVKASVAGMLNVWLDVNRNGLWTDAGDHVFVDYNLTAGWNTLTLNVPANAATGFSYMRFRFNLEGGLNFFGPASEGEVEDYRVRIFPEGWGFIVTPDIHTILVPLNVLLTNTGLSAQDAIGVWYEDDNGNMVCGGADIWDGFSDRVVLAYGDDNTTSEKDGFDNGEKLLWKIHHSASATDEYVMAEYDPGMPQSDGTFTSFGLSKLTGMIGVSVTATAAPESVCAGDAVQLDAIAAGGSGNYTYSWTSNPAGFTSDEKDPVDYPTQDITYTIEVNDGLSTASASVSVSVQPAPFADAGIDVTICENETYQLKGSVNNSNNYIWSTSGDGDFDDETALDAVYTPGAMDAANGTVILTLTADAIPPCQLQAESSMVLSVMGTQNVSLFQGWNGLSGYLSPYNQNNNNDLFGPVLDNLVIVYNMNGDFWPDQGVNTLVWDEKSGYVMKLDADDEMVFCGDEVSDKVVNLEQEWNIVPVLCEFDADITSVFDADVDVKIVLEVAGWKVFWPDYTINTILNLEMGKAYFAYMNSDDDIDFGNASIKSGIITNPVRIAETPWNEVNRSPGGHVVAFAGSACEGFAPGDVIGAFTGSGLCAAITSYQSVI